MWGQIFVWVMLIIFVALYVVLPIGMWISGGKRRRSIPRTPSARKGLGGYRP